ncbi:MAG: tetratricopeptide repeat protein, partial [Myxococcota bacterium]
EADRLVETGRAAMVRYEVPKALQAFNEALAILPDHPSALLERGAAYYYEGDHAGSVADLERATQLIPNNARAHFFLGASFLRLNQHERALGEFNQTIQLQNGNARAHFYRGQVFLAMGEYRNSFKNCLQAIKIRPDYYVAICSRALLELLRNNRERAFELLDQASQLRPRDPTAFILKGTVLIGMNRHRQAVQLFHQIARIESDHDEPLPAHYHEQANDGSIYSSPQVERLKPVLSPDEFLTESSFWQSMGMGTNSVSAKKLVMSLQVALSNLLYKYYVGQYELTMSNLSLILYFVKPLTQFLLSMTTDGSSYMQEFKSLTAREAYYLARRLIRLEKYELAGSTLDRYFQNEETETPWLHLARGMAHEGLRGREERAIESYSRAIELDAGLARAFVLRGRTYMRTKRIDRARADFERAIELDELRHEAAYSLGEIARERGDLAAQRRWWRKALELRPDLLELRDRLDHIEVSPPVAKEGDR